MDAVKEGSVELGKLEAEELPEEMQGMSLEEKNAHVEAQLKTRRYIQQRIQELQGERKQYIVEKRQEVGQAGESTLDEALIEALRSQASKQSFSLE